MKHQDSSTNRMVAPDRHWTNGRVSLFDRVLDGVWHSLHIVCRPATLLKMIQLLLLNVLIYRICWMYAIRTDGNCVPKSSRYTFAHKLLVGWRVGRAMASSSSSSSSRVGHPQHQQQQQLQRASSAPVAGADAAASNSAKSNVKLTVTNKALTTSAKRSRSSSHIYSAILRLIL